MNSTPIVISDSGELPAKKTDKIENFFRRLTIQRSPPTPNSVYKPVNWTSRKIKQSLAEMKIGTGLDPVVNWMDTNKSDRVLSDENSGNNEYQTHSTTFFRCDYKVDGSETSIKHSDSGLTGSISNKSVHICNSLKLTKKNEEPPTLSQPTDEFPSNGYPATQTKNESTNEPNYSNSQSRNNNSHFSPSTAESRKKELCNYLKLMNHADKKEVCLSQYRRSTRVKNLEQKELAKKMQIDDCCKASEEKLKEVCVGKSHKSLTEKLNNLGDSISLQSFTDLNMTVDASRYPTLQEKQIFNFVMPPDEVLSEFNDFQHWIEPIILNINKCNNNKQNDGMWSDMDRNNFNEDSSNHGLSNNRNEENMSNGIEKKCRDGSVTPNPKSSQFEMAMDIHESQSNERTSYNLRRTKSCDNVMLDTLHENMNGSSIQSQSSIKLSPVTSTTSNSIINDCKRGIKRKLNGSVVRSDVNIRVHYDAMTKSSELIIDDSTHEENFSQNETSSESGRYCQGFTDDEMKESRELNTKLTNLLLQLSSSENISPDETMLNEYDDEPPDAESFYTIEVDNYSSSNHENDDLSDSVSDSLSSLESEDSSGSNSEENQNSDDDTGQKCDIVSPSEISPRTQEILPFDDNVEMQTLHSLLKKQVKKIPSLSAMTSVQDWDSDNSICEKQKLESKHSSHFVSLDKDNGPVQAAFYVDFHLLLIQDSAVSLWNQTALGHILGAQNLWIFNGCTKKLILNKECIRKKALEMVISTEACVAYVELWTKEHKSDIRQGPVADVFAIVYFWMQKLNKMDKKVLQLENIYGFADDVQYVVLKPSLNIVVSWHSAVENNKGTQIHVYTFAPDFQTISDVRALSKVEHYVSSLHNIEDCEELLMGCGEDKITLWNIEHGYIVASIELSDIKLSFSTLWVKCDRGILFTLQQCVDQELRLIAINGRSHSWKRLKSYKPPDGFERIQNVYIENGVLISFYEEGILCWKAQSGEQIVEEIHNETEIEYFPSGKYLIMTTEKNVFIRHALTHLLTVDD